MNLTLAVAIIVPLAVALIGALVTLFSKHLESRSAVEERHASAREEAFDRLLAAGDAAWLCRNEQRDLNPRIVLPDPDAVALAANSLFMIGADRLKAHARDYEAEEPMLATWFHAAFDDPTIGPKTFESIRDQLASRRRMETGLRQALIERGEKPLLERLRAGEHFKRTPEGLGQVMYTDDPGAFIVTGGGKEFAELFDQMMNESEAVHNSRETAYTRIVDWEARGIWKWPAGSEPRLVASEEKE